MASTAQIHNVCMYASSKRWRRGQPNLQHSFAMLLKHHLQRVLSHQTLPTNHHFLHVIALVELVWQPAPRFPATSWQAQSMACHVCALTGHSDCTMYDRNVSTGGIGICFVWTDILDVQRRFGFISGFAVLVVEGLQEPFLFEDTTPATSYTCQVYADFPNAQYNPPPLHVLHGVLSTVCPRIHSQL